MPDPAPSRPAADRNLLVGILALQMNFVTRDQLIGGMQSWVFDKTKPLGQILLDQGALQPERHALLEALVREHLKLHGNDPEKSLAAVSSVGSVRQELRQIADPDLQASLANVSAARPVGDDPWGTHLPSVGRPTSTGLRFRILRPHAQGGLGQVSVALDEELHREVALKEIQDRHADHPESRSRFVLEAEITGGLEHPGIVPVYGLGTYADGRPFYAMRFIQGDSLKDAIERFHQAELPGRDAGERTLELRKLLGRFLDVCNAIAYAHSRGVLHRDLKPGNIMLGKYGETLVVDWGLAKAVGQAEDHASTGERPLDPSSAGESTPTQAGAALGTPQYMSPEQAAGRLDELGAASDVYSLGATLYSLLTGKAPVEGPDVGAVLRRVQEGDFPPPRRVRNDVPGALEAVCLKAMARNPADRYRSPRILADDLEHWLADEPVSAWPEPWTFRARRWLSRHQTLTTAVTACILLATVGLAAGAWLLAAANERERSARSREQRARAVAEQKEQEATEQRAEAECQRDETRAHLYAAHMRLAQYAQESGFLDRGRELLDGFRPGPGEKDLRGFEWYYLARLCRNNQVTLQGHQGPIYCITFSPDGRSLISGDGTGAVKIWRLEKAGEVASIQAHTSVVWAVASEPAGKTFATASADQTVKIWDAATHEARRTLSGHTGVVYTLAYRPDGKMLASGSADKTVRLWDLATARTRLTLRGHTGWVTTLAFSPDGKTLATGSDDGTIKLWDPETGRATATLTGHTEDLVYVTFSPDGETLASASTDQTVKLWDVKTGRVKTTLRGHSDYVACVVYAPGGALLATSSADGTAKLWDTTTYQLRATLQGHTGVLYGLAFSPDGKTLATAAGGDKTIKFWDVATGRPRPRASGPLECRTCAALEGHTGVVYGVAVGPDGKVIATASRDGTARVWDAATGQLRAILQGHGGPVYGVAFAPDGRTAVTASEDKTAKLWDVGSWQVKATLQGHEGPVYGVAFAPDGRTLATASEDGTARLWDAGSGQPVAVLRGHTGALRVVAFAPDGTTLATGGADKTIRIWSLRTLQNLAILQGHTDMVAGLAYSPDGAVLASGSMDLTVRLWDTATRRLRVTLEGHNDAVTCVAFSPDGRTLASASWDRSAKLWNGLTGQEMITLKGHTRWVSCVAFSRDGLLLAAGSGDKTASLWHAPAPQ